MLEISAELMKYSDHDHWRMGKLPHLEVSPG